MNFTIKIDSNNGSVIKKALELIELQADVERKEKLFDLKTNGQAYATDPISCLELTVRTENCLLSEGIKTIYDLVISDRERLKRLPNLGKKSYDELCDVLDEIKYVTEFVKRRT